MSYNRKNNNLISEGFGNLGPAFTFLPKYLQISIACSPYLVAMFLRQQYPVMTPITIMSGFRFSCTTYEVLLSFSYGHMCL